MKSPFGKLNYKDLLKGFITTIISTILSGTYQSFQDGSFDSNTLKTSAVIGIGSGISYLIKNIFTNSEDEFLKSENTEEEPKQ